MALDCVVGLQCYLYVGVSKLFGYDSCIWAKTHEGGSFYPLLVKRGIDSKFLLVFGVSDFLLISVYFLRFL
jgi:hypothetical protein